MSTGAHRVVKATQVMGGFDARNYKTERLWAPGTDDIMIPISIVYRPDVIKKDGTDPVCLSEVLYPFPRRHILRISVWLFHSVF